MHNDKYVAGGFCFCFCFCFCFVFVFVFVLFCCVVFVLILKIMHTWHLYHMQVWRENCWQIPNFMFQSKRNEREVPGLSTARWHLPMRLTLSTWANSVTFNTSSKLHSNLLWIIKVIENMYRTCSLLTIQLLIAKSITWRCYKQCLSCDLLVTERRQEFIKPWRSTSIIYELIMLIRKKTR